MCKPERKKRNFSTYFNLAFLSNLGPILRRNTRPPIKFNSNWTWGLLFRSPKASSIITRLGCSESKMSRFHMIRIMIRVAVRRTDLINKNLHYHKLMIWTNTQKRERERETEREVSIWKQNRDDHDTVQIQIGEDKALDRKRKSE